MEPTERYGDVQRTVPLSNRFHTNYIRYIDSNAYSEYNQIDGQIWLQMYDSDNSEYLTDIYVINLESGGQLSLYEFEFTHTCFKYVNDEMLIGADDGKLYKLDKITIVADRGLNSGQNLEVKVALQPEEASAPKKRGRPRKHKIEQIPVNIHLT